MLSITIIIIIIIVVVVVAVVIDDDASNYKSVHTLLLSVNDIT
jgi:hypothetical protein